MAELTKRGEEDRKRDEETMTGEPVDGARRDAAGTQPAPTTRDKGRDPAADRTGEEREGHR